MNPLARLGVAARRGFGRVTPDPFVLAVMLTAAVLVAALVVGEPAGGPLELASRWSDTEGLWKLLTFGMQATLMLVLGSALAEAPALRRRLTALAARPRTPRGLVALTALVSILLALLNWSLALVGGALLARAAGARASREGWSLHYPLLCAAGYSGMMVWHGGLSGTAPLKATGAADLLEVLGPELAARVGSIPLDRTLFSPFNLVVTGGLLVGGPLLFAALTPSEDPEPIAFDPTAGEGAGAAPEAAHGRDGDPGEGSTGVEDAPLITWLLAVPMLVALVAFGLRKGVTQLDLNTVNLALWVAAMLAHGRPRAFIAACERGLRGCTGIILQFPLYAGIMGVMASAGLSARITALVSNSGPEGLAAATFLSAGALNLLVPSGGGQWAVQGPILVEAALALDVKVERALMAMAYGDQWTNMLQPFWALPLLAITGVRARDIVGYTAIWMVLGGAWMLAALCLWP